MPENKVMTPDEFLKKNEESGIYKQVFENPYTPGSTHEDKGIDFAVPDNVNISDVRPGTTYQEAINKADENQGAFKSMGVGVAKGLLNAIPSLMQNMGNIFSAQPFTKDYMNDSNILQTWGNALTQKVNDALPIYQGNQDNHWLDDGWWAENLSGLVSSAVGFVATGALTGGALNVIGESVEGLATLSKGQNALKWLQTAEAATTGNVVKTVANSWLLNKAEGIGIAVQTAKDVYDYRLIEGKKKGMSDEDADSYAKKYAGEAGATAMSLNRLNILSNLTSAGEFIKSPNATRFLLEKMTGHEIGHELLHEGVQESIEETVNQIAQDKGTVEGKGGTYSMQQLGNTVFSDSGLSNALMGFIGGAGQQGLTHAYKSINGTYAQHNQRFDEQQNVIAEQDKAFSDKKMVNTFDTFKNLHETVQLTQELQKAQLAGDQKKVDEINDKLLHTQAFTAFKSGTTDNLINNFKGVGEWIEANPEEAQKLGYETNPKSDDYYKTKIDNALSQIDKLEGHYLSSLKYENQQQVYRNLANQTIRENRIDEISKEIETKKSQSDDLLNANNFKSVDDTEKFKKENEGYKTLQSDISKLENVKDKINQGIISLKEEHIELTSAKTQQEIKDKREETLKAEQEKAKQDAKLAKAKEQELKKQKIKKGEDVQKMSTEETKKQSSVFDDVNDDEVDTETQKEELKKEEETKVEDNKSEEEKKQEDDIVDNSGISSLQAEIPISEKPINADEKLVKESDIINEQLHDHLDEMEAHATNDYEKNLVENLRKQVGTVITDKRSLANAGVTILKNATFKENASPSFQDAFSNEIVKANNKGEGKTELTNNDISGKSVVSKKVDKKIDVILDELNDMVAKSGEVLFNPSEDGDSESTFDVSHDESNPIDLNKIKLYGELISLIPPKMVFQDVKSKEPKLVPLGVFFAKIANISPKFNEFARNNPEEIIRLYNQYASLYDKGSKFSITKKNFVTQILPLLDNKNFGKDFDADKDTDIPPVTIPTTILTNSAKLLEEEVVNPLTYLFADAVNSGSIIRNRAIKGYDKKGNPIWVNIDNNLKEGVNTDILDIDELNPGTEGYFTVDTSYEENGKNVYEENKGKDTKDLVEVLPLIFVYTNSRGVTKKLSLNLPSYLQERLDLSVIKGDENYIETIRQQQIRLNTLREHIINEFESGNKQLKTKVTDKIVTNFEESYDHKYHLLSDAFPDTNLQFAVFKNGKLVVGMEDSFEQAFDDKKYEIKNKIQYKDGVVYSIIPLKKLANGKTQVALVTNSNNTIDTVHATTLSNILKVFLKGKNNTLNANEQQIHDEISKQFGVNMKSPTNKSLISIMSKFLTMHNNTNKDIDKNVEDLVREYQNTKDKFKDSGRKPPRVLTQITNQKISVLDLETGELITAFTDKEGRSDFRLVGNNNKVLTLDQFVNRFEKVLPYQFSNVDIQSINKKNFSLPIIKRNADKSLEYSTKQFNGYNDFVKTQLRTPFVSMNIGTQENPKYSYVASVITVDTEGILNKENNETVVKPVKKKTTKTDEYVTDLDEVFKENKSTEPGTNKGLKLQKGKKKDENGVIKPLPDKFSLDNPRELSEDELNSFQTFITDINYTAHYNTLINDSLFNILSKVTNKERININSELELIKNNIKALYDEGIYEKDMPLLHSDLNVILNNWNKVEGDIKEKLQKFEAIATVDTVNYDLFLNKDDFDVNTFEKTFGQDSLKSNPKDTLSNRFKVFLSTIVNMGEHGIVQRNVFGLKRYTGFSEIFNTLTDVLANVDNDFPTMVQTIERELPDIEWKYDLLVKLNNAPKEIQNEFVNAMTNHRNDMLVMNFEYGLDEKGNIKSRLLVGNSNLSSKEAVVFSKWKDKFANSKFGVLSNENIIVQDRQQIQKFLDKYDEIAKNAENNDDYLKGIKELMSEFGIDISDRLLSELKSTEDVQKNIFIKDKGKTLTLQRHFIDNKGIFRSLYNDMKDLMDNENDVDLKLSKNNPLNNSSIKLFSARQAKYDTNLNTQSFRNVNGNTYYAFAKNKFVNKRLNDLLTNKELVQQLKDNPFTSEASWLHKLWGATDIRNENENIQLFAADGISEIDGDTKKSFDELTDFEQELFRIGQFINNNKNTSTFVFPTTLGKQTINLVEVSREGLGNHINADGTINDNIVDKMFEILVRPELQRMMQVGKIQLELQSINEDRVANGLKSMQLSDVINDKDYLKGWNRFYFVPELNNIGLGDILSEDMLTGKVQDKIKKHLKVWLDNRINDTIRDWSSLGLVKDGKLNIDADYQKDKTDRFIAANYTLEYINAMVNFHQLFIGDTAQYFKGVTFDEFIKNNKYEKLSKAKQDELYTEYVTHETGVNIGKRSNGIVAPGQELPYNSNNTTIRTMILKDRKSGSVSLDYYKEIDKQFGTNIAEEYSKGINGTDAQEFVTLEERLNTMMGLGEITEEKYNELIDKGNKNTLSDEDINLILLAEKPVYFGHVFDKYNDKIVAERRMYIKSSAIPLIPQLTKGLEIDKLRDIMTKEKINRVAYESAVKVGNPVNAVNIYDAQGNIKNFKSQVNQETGENEYVDDEGKKIFNQSDVLQLSRENYRIQQNIPYKKGDNIVDGTQQRKLLFLNVMGQTFNHNGKQISGKELNDEYVKLYKSWLDNAFERLKHEIFTPEGKVDNNKLSQILVSEGIKRGYSQSMIDSFRVNANGKFDIPLWANTQNQKVQNLMMAIIDNRLRRLEFNGKSYVLVSQEGFKPQLKVIDENENLPDEGVIWTENFDRTKGLKRNQIIVPFSFKDDNGKILNLKDFVKNGKIDTEKLPSELLKLFGYRIPTQGHNSMIDLEVVGFSDSALKDFVIASRDLVLQMGSDFDVDKLYTFGYNYSHDKATNKLSRLSDEKNITEYKKEIIKRDIQEIKNVYKPLLNELYNSKNDVFQTAQKEINDIYNQKLITLDDLKKVNKHLNYIDNELYKLNKIKAMFLPFAEHEQIRELMTQEDIDFLDKRIEELTKAKSTPDSIIKKSFDAGLIKERVELRNQELDNYDQKIANVRKVIEEKINEALGKISNDDYINNYTTKQIQNKLLDIHFSVLQNEEVKKQMSTAVSYGELKYTKDGKVDGVIAKINNLRNKRENKGKTYITTNIYQRNGYIDSNGAAQAIGIFANTNIVNAFMQQSEDFRLLENVNGNIISPEYEIFGIKNKELNSTRNNKGVKSDAISAYLSAAVDNDKEQILQNVNKHTYSFIQAALHYGFDEELIQVMLDQDIILDYVKELNKLSQINDNQFGDRKELAREAILKKYGNEIYTKSLTLDDGYNMIEKGSKISEYNQKQSKILDTFLALSNKGEKIAKIGSVISVDSKGLKENLFYIQEVFNAYTDLISDDYVKGFTETFNNSVNKTFFDKTYNLQNPQVGDYYYQHFTPMIRGGFDYIFNKMKDSFKNVGDTPFERAKLKSDVFKEYLKYINSSSLTGLTENETVDQARRRLNYDYVEDGYRYQYSLAARIDAFKEQGLKDNYFLNSLQTDIKFDKNPSTIKFLGAADNELDESYIINGINDLFTSDVSLVDQDSGEVYTTRNLIQDLILHQFINGGIQSGFEFVKYIPVQYLKLIGYSDYLNNRLNEVNVGNFISQYFQHNPKSLPYLKYNAKYNSGDFSKRNEGEFNGEKLTHEWYQMDDYETLEKIDIAIPSVFTVTKVKDGIEMPKMFRTKFPQRNKEVIYVKINDGKYMRLDKLGNNSMSEYNTENRVQNSSIKWNQSGDILKFNSKPEREDEGVKVDNTLPDVNRYNLNSGNVINVLTAVKEKTTDVLLKKVIDELIKSNNVSDIVIKVNENIKSKGKYFVDTKLANINPNQVTSEKDLQETIIHEVIHGIVYDAIRNPKTTKQKVISERINKFREKAFDELTSSLKLSKSDVDYVLNNIKNNGFTLKISVGDNVISKYHQKLIYSLSNMDEFFTGALTDSSVKSFLNGIKYSDKETTLTKFVKLLENLFKELGFSKDTLLFYTTKNMLDFISENSNIKGIDSIVKSNYDKGVTAKSTKKSKKNSIIENDNQGKLFSPSEMIEDSLNSIEDNMFNQENDLNDFNSKLSTITDEQIEEQIKHC